MMTRPDRSGEASRGGGTRVRVTVIGADGSVPRDAGAAMVVTADGLAGTIGGGALEHAAMQAARRLLAEAAPGPWRRQVLALPLGPSLGQCCGGHVRLLLEPLEEAEAAQLDPAARAARLIVRPLAGGEPPLALRKDREMPPLPSAVGRAASAMLSGARAPALAVVKGWLIEPVRRPAAVLHLYGAGHVGRAVARIAAALPLQLVWIDTAPGRFPDAPPETAEIVVAANPAEHARTAPAGGYHLVLTYSHALDLAVCDALLSRGDFAFLGLIGSDTKRARFLRRLAEAGHGAALLARLVCPIGIEGIPGKEPATIAVAAVAQILQEIAKAEALVRSIREAAE